MMMMVSNFGTDSTVFEGRAQPITSLILVFYLSDPERMKGSVVFGGIPANTY